MSTQSIIVYRNPLEQQIWEGGIIFPVIAGVVVFFIVFMTLEKLLRMSKLPMFVPAYTQLTNLALLVAAAAGLGLMGYLLM
jgi:hypothetical protein